MLKIKYISVVIYFNLYPIHYNKVNFKNLVLAYIDLDMIQIDKFMNAPSIPH